MHPSLWIRPVRGTTLPKDRYTGRSVPVRTMTICSVSEEIKTNLMLHLYSPACVRKLWSSGRAHEQHTWLALTWLRISLARHWSSASPSRTERLRYASPSWRGIMKATLNRYHSRHSFQHNTRRDRCLSSRNKCSKNGNRRRVRAHVTAETSVARTGTSGGSVVVFLLSSWRSSVGTQSSR